MGVLLACSLLRPRTAPLVVAATFDSWPPFTLLSAAETFVGFPQQPPHTRQQRQTAPPTANGSFAISVDHLPGDHRFGTKIVRKFLETDPLAIVCWVIGACRGGGQVEHFVCAQLTVLFHEEDDAEEVEESDEDREDTFLPVKPTEFRGSEWLTCERGWSKTWISATIRGSSLAWEMNVNLVHVSLPNKTFSAEVYLKDYSFGEPSRWTRWAWIEHRRNHQFVKRFAALWQWRTL